MRRGSGRIPILVGVALIAIAVAMLVCRGVENSRAQAASNSVLEQMQAATPNGPNEDFTDVVSHMPVFILGNTAYLGTLSIPSVGTRLPVCAFCNDELLRVSPCRYLGSYVTDDLVVCGQGYASQFGNLARVGIRDEVRLLAVDGSEQRYLVSNMEREPLEQIDKVQDDWDLTLFTFNADNTCCVVRCVRV